MEVVKRITSRLVIVMAISICTLVNAYSQSSNDSNGDEYYKHSVDFSPFTPLGDVYSIQYNFGFSSKDELITGFSYVNIEYENVGNNSAPGIILGYRRFLWKSLHIQYELWPGYDAFYESNERKSYKGFQLWNEFRLGYQFNYTIKSKSLYVSLQWPFGFYLVKGNKPQSFTDYEKDHRYFYNIPLIYIGLKF